MWKRNEDLIEALLIALTLLMVVGHLNLYATVVMLIVLILKLFRMESVSHETK